ncbi:hypothetical protein Taro_032784, partial [Colocasia esculenta]|nr:hypothetical protein [Colocasia esculenta]
VDTTNLGVDTMVQNKGRNVKKSPSQVDTSLEQVDTTPSQVDPTVGILLVSGKGFELSPSPLSSISSPFNFSHSSISPAPDSTLLSWHQSSILAVEPNQGPRQGPFQQMRFLPLKGDQSVDMILLSSQGLYLLREVQQAKREQFRTLQQEKLSVLEYQMQFMALSRYAPYVVTDNAMMVVYFIRGLRTELQDAVAPLMCRTVEEAAQRAAVLERTLQTRQSQSQAGSSGSFRLPQQAHGISKGKTPSRASSSGFAKWGGKLKRIFKGGGRGGGRQQGFQPGFQQGRGFRPAPEESQQSTVEGPSNSSNHISHQQKEEEEPHTREEVEAE